MSSDRSGNFSEDCQSEGCRSPSRYRSASGYEDIKSRPGVICDFYEEHRRLTRALISWAMMFADGNISKAAKSLNMNRTTLSEVVKKHFPELRPVSQPLPEPVHKWSEINHQHHVVGK